MKRRESGRARAARAALALTPLSLIAAGLFVAPLRADAEAWRWNLPPGFPVPLVPADNPMTAAKVELGEQLFFDPRLSQTGAYACASCHDPARAFTDGRAQAVGATGEQHPRGAMSLVNVAYNASFGWASPHLRELEDQAAVPMLSRHPIELGLADHEDRVMAALLADPAERSAFERAFPETEGEFTLLHVRRALASFERTLISAQSAYDRYVFHDEREAMSESARRGMRLFFSERVGCAGCHPAPLFMSPAVYDGTSVEPRFHDTGLYDPDGAGRHPGANPGVFEHTRRLEDLGHFRVPTLRNVAKTAPYMHDGSIETLPDVVRHYSAGGRNKSPELRVFELRAGDVDDLVAFLTSLSDADPAYATDAEGRSR